MLSLQRAKPFCATATQPPGQLSFRRFVHQSTAQVEQQVPKFPCACSPQPAIKRSSLSDVYERQAMHFGTAHSSIPGNKKMRRPSLCLCPLPAPSRIFSIALHTAVFPAPSAIANRKSHPFPMFLQPIAGIPFSDAEPRFIPTAYALPSPRTAVWFHSLWSFLHTAAFALSSSRFESCHKSEF